jgi:hypothetical protein
MADLVRVVADASAAPDEGRLGEIPVTHLALDRDCRLATGHDFQWAKAERERQDGLEQHRALQPQA